MIINRKKLMMTMVLALTLLMVFGVVAFAKQITVIGTSDIHGAIYPWSYKIGEHDDIGLAKVNEVVNSVKAENPNVILVDAGDTIQGNTLTGLYKDKTDVVHPLMAVMNYMGYEAMTLGNHEFNFGLETQQRILKDAEFPILSANIVRKDTGELYMKPYTITEVDGVKVGILGLTTPNIPIWDGDKVDALEFQDMDKAAQKYLPELEEKADIIIAIVHAGLDGRYDESGGDRARKVAQNNPQIDVMITGHDHETVKETVNGVLVMASSDAGEEVSRIDLTLEENAGEWEVTAAEGTHLSTEDYAADPGVLEVAKSYHETVVEYVNTPIGYATGDFTPEDEVEGIPAAQVQDTALVDLINRVQLEYSDADISSAALFVSDSTINKGPVSIKDAARIYKYSNTLYAVEVTGAELKEYMEWTAAYFNTYQPGDITVSFNPDIRGYNYDMFTGVEYKIDISKPAGNRITDLTYNGKPVKDDQTFKLAVNNYRYSGMHADGIFSNDPYYKSEEGIRELIIEYIDNKGTIKPVVDNNWELIGADLGHWAREEAISLVNNDILEIPSVNRSWNGESINMRENVSRAKLTKALIRMFNYDVPEKVEEPTFTDVEAEFLPYAEAALMAGLVTENGGKFMPNEDVTRREAAVMLIDAMRLAGVENKVEQAAEMGLISGDLDDVMTMSGFVSMLYKANNDYKQIDVLTTNDFHGKLEAGYEAGAAKLTGAINHYRDANAAGTILVDAGDAYQGTPISSLNQAKPVIEFMNHAKYVAQAVGNHEFDWGIDTLKEINSQTYFPLLAANIFDKETGELVDWAQPTRLIPANGVKIGLIGISTPDTIGTTMPSNVAHLEFGSPVEAIRKWTFELRKQGADLVIVVGHLPGSEDYETGELSGELVKVAKEVGVDGIVGGHSHHTVTAVVNGNPIVEAYKHGRELGNLRYFINKNTGEVYKTVPMAHPVRKSVIDIEADPYVAKLVAKYQKELEPIMSEVLIEIDEPLKRNYDQISKIGAIATDGMRNDANADIAFQNPGGLRIDIQAGEVNVGHIYELLPFGNTIVTGEMTGSQIVDILEQSFTFEKGMMQMSGLIVKYDSTKPAYERVVEVMLADGTPLVMDKTYKVATNNFLAEGGDGFSTFTEVEFTNTYKKVRDSVIEYLRQHEQVDPEAAGRAIDVSKQAAINIKFAA